MKKLFFVLLLSSCSSLPLVDDQDADGNPKVPVCPQCNEHFNKSFTGYQCPNNHYGVSVKWHGQLGADTSKLKLVK